MAPSPSAPPIAFESVTDLVSVVIPTYNRAEFLPDAIRSVLEQSHRDVELIVVDDGSTDHTSAFLRDISDERVQVVSIAHSGNPARARNVGIDRAKGQFLAFLDSDDVWHSAKLERQMAALRTSPTCRWSYTLFDHIDERGVPMAPLRGGVGNPRSGWILSHMVTEDALVMVQSVLAESSLVREVGGFDETPQLREDLDLCFRLAARSPASAVDDDLVHIRHHTGRTTFALAEVREWRVRALRKLARSVPDSAIRRLCRRECAREFIDLARLYDGSGRTGHALKALVRALPVGMLGRSWWTTLAKTLVRPLTSKRMREAYHRARARAGTPRSDGQDAS